MTEQWVCPMGHENHDTNEEQFCDDAVCHRDIHDSEFAQCGFIFPIGVMEEDVMRWADQDSWNRNEDVMSKTWTFCMPCHEELLLLCVNAMT